MPLVSVVMPVYNGELYLAEAIDSILAQTFTDFELLVVDDGSTDDSAVIVQAYEERDSRVRFFQLERNMGGGDARNHAIAYATGKLIAQMDCDDVSLPPRLEKQVGFLRAHPDIGGIGAGAHVLNHDFTTLLYNHEAQREHALVAWYWFMGYAFLHPTHMIRRNYLDAIGGYEPGRRICDDLDLLARLLHHTPIRFAGLPDCLLLIRKHDQSKFRRPAHIEHEEERKIKRSNLERLWGEAPEASMDRLFSLRSRAKLGWAERRAAKNDLRRLIDAMIAHNWVDADDKTLLIAEMNRRLEQASPRIWQQFCHWRRHRFPRLFPDTFQIYQ